MDNHVPTQDSIVTVHNLTFSRGEKKIFDDISLELNAAKSRRLWDQVEREKPPF